MDIKKFSLSKRPEKFRDILIVLVVFSAALLAFLFLISNLNLVDTNLAYRQDIDTLSSGWHAKSASLDEDVSLPLWVDLEKEESVYLTISVPPVDTPYDTIVTKNYHQRLFAYLDGKKIYEFPKESERMSESIITNDWNMIRIPKDAEGKELTIEYRAGIAPYHGYIGAPMYGEDNAIISYLKGTYFIPYALALGLIIIGVLLIVIATVYARNFSDKHSFVLGFVFISTGIWFTDRSQMPMFMVGSNMKFFVAFSTLTLVSVLVALYAGERFKRHSQLFPNLLIYGFIALDAVLFGLVAAGKSPIHALVPYVYLSILVSCLYLVYLLWYHSFGKGRRVLNRVQLNAVRLEFIAALITIAGSALSILWDAMISNNWNTTHREWSGVGNIQMGSVVIFAFAHLVILLYNSYYGVLENESTQKQLHDSQLQLMMSQIQPHFMFNTLSSIRTLIKVDADTAYNMIFDFSKYLRANVDNLTNLDGIQFAEEVSHIQSYVGIEKVRFGDRLAVEYDIKETDFIVPPLSIQPLVENAIKHGVCKRAEGGTVWLRSYKEGENYIVEVQDDGVGIPEERMAFIKGDDMDMDDTFSNIHLSGNGSEVHQSTGMRNITLRLKEICNASLEISSEEGKGTLMRVIFPPSGQVSKVGSSEAEG